MRVIWAIIRKNLTAFLRSRARLILSLIMPLFMLFVFSFVVNSSLAGLESPTNYLIAGVVIMIVFQSVFNNSTAVLNDISSGFMKEIIVAPVARRDIALGNIFSAAVLAVVQGLMVLLPGFALGFRTSVGGFIGMVLLMLLSGIVLSAIVLFLSLIAKNQTNFQIMSSVVLMPAMFLSGAYIPTALIPKFILPLVYINPLTYLTAAFRYVALGMSDLSMNELINVGVAFRFGPLTVTPMSSWLFVLAIGSVFLFFCVDKFKKINLLEVQGSVRGRRAF